MSSEVSREKPIDYALMARLLIEERDRGGYPIWVTGPALVHSRARSDMTWFIANGFVGALLAGNAVAVHDIEASIFGTTLGMDSQGGSTQGGHGLHMRAINRVRAAGSIEAAVANGTITDGIMHACVVHKVPFVLTGSIRDDGPLPGVLNDMAQAQDAMKAHTIKATMAILVATALHAIATGNMLPAFVTEPDGTLRELPTICVDSSEFVVSKLKDRGTHQAFGVVTNAQDFMHILRLYVERELDARGAEIAARVGGDGVGEVKKIVAEGRERFLREIAEQLPVDRVEELHLFSSIRQGGNESAIAVVALRPELEAEGSEARRTVYRARYRLALKGTERGKWEMDIVEEADAPTVTVDEVVRGVLERAGDAEEPERLSAADLRAIVADEPWSSTTG